MCTDQHTYTHIHIPHIHVTHMLDHHIMTRTHKREGGTQTPARGVNSYIIDVHKREHDVFTRAHSLKQTRTLGGGWSESAFHTSW